MKRHGAQFGIALAICAVVASSPALSQHTGTGDQLRGDIDRQKQISEHEREIERTWQMVEEVRASAQRFRLAHARLRDVLENKDCAVAGDMLRNIQRTQESIVRLKVSLDGQCRSIDRRTQKQLADACRSERAALDAEMATTTEQRDRVFASCPDLKR